MPASAPDLDGYIARTQLMERWCRSYDGIRWFENAGLLTPCKIGSYLYYSLDEVGLVETAGMHIRKRASKSREMRPRHLKIQAYSMFKRGASCSDIVLMLGLLPEEIDKLYASYKRDDLEDRYRDNLYAKLREDDVSESKNKGRK